MSEAPRPHNQKNRIFLLWVLCIATGAVIVLGAPVLPESTLSHEFIEALGAALVFTAVMGRLWSILYIGSKKNAELVTIGPYSISRNPLYLFSICGLVGTGLIFGSAVLTIVLLLVAWMIFRQTALAEAKFLRAKFGAAYEAYAAETPLVLPKPSLYKSGSEITFSAKALGRTFRDCLPFLALYPMIELTELARAAGVLKPLFHLP
ncbi:methyltransferase family protein [Oryzifoliimicrobium ureilyticus]|uniref:methyltransferase family protein n=1 Tax=Oryzifoliimicrobium ureilyticus TaxID=3113724 RepID=UPI00307671F2